MPCRSEYLEMTESEKEIILVKSLIDEIDGKLFDHHEAKRKHEYSSECVHELTDLLCKKCSEIKNIQDYSLDLQIWWRDHQISDARRISQEKERLTKQIVHYELIIDGIKKQLESFNTRQ